MSGYADGCPTGLLQRPRGRSRLRRGLLGLLALFMVPVVVVTTSGSAVAADVAYGRLVRVYGESERFVDVVDKVAFLKIECSFAARYKVTLGDQSIPVTEGTCDSFSGSVAAGQPFDLVMFGQTSTGQACEGIGSGTFGGDSSYLGFREHATFATEVHFDPIMGPQVEQGCAVTSFELRAPGSAFWDAAVTIYGSANLGNMPTVAGDVEPPASTSTCEHFDPSSVRVWINNPKAFPAYTGYPPPGTNYTVVHFEVRGVRKTAAAKVVVMALMQKPDGSTQWVSWSSDPENPLAAGNGWESWSGIGVANAYTRVIGVHVMSRPYVAGAEQAADSVQDTLAHKREIAWAWQTSAGDSYRYDNDPANCLWWFGDKKHADDPASSMDEPHGGVLGAPAPTVATGEGAEGDTAGAKPVAERDSCGFKWSDPTTYAGAGICAVVSALSYIYDLLASVPGTILDGLTDVFVPDSGAMTRDLASVSTAWGNSAPGQYVDAFGLVADAAVFDSPGCSGPLLDLPDMGFTSADLTLRPFDACAGAMKDFAGIFRIGLTLFAYAGAALAGLRVVSGSIGLNLNGVGRGGPE